MLEYVEVQVKDDPVDEVVVEVAVVARVVDGWAELVATEKDVVEREVEVVVVIDGTELTVDVGTDVGVEVEELLERAKYAAAPATAIITTITTARTTVAMPLDDFSK